MLGVHGSLLRQAQDFTTNGGINQSFLRQKNMKTSLEAMRDNHLPVFSVAPIVEAQRRAGIDLS